MERRMELSRSECKTKKAKGKKGDGKSKGKPLEGECLNCLEKCHRAAECKNETHPLVKAGKAGGKDKGSKARASKAKAREKEKTTLER